MSLPPAEGLFQIYCKDKPLEMYYLVFKGVLKGSVRRGSRGRGYNAWHVEVLKSGALEMSGQNESQIYLQASLAAEEENLEFRRKRAL